MTTLPIAGHTGHTPLLLQPTATSSGESFSIIGPGGAAVGRVIFHVRQRRWTGHVDGGVGPERDDPLRAAADAALLWSYDNPHPPAGTTPFPGEDEARKALYAITGLRQGLVDASARAFYFEALRQPQMALLLPALERLRDQRYVGCMAGCRLTINLLEAVRTPARALRDAVQGDERAWMNFPLVELLSLVEHARDRLSATAASSPAPLRGGFTGRFSARHEGDEALAALRRVVREWVTEAVATLPASPGPLHAASAAVAESVSGLPVHNPASSAERCRATATQLSTVARAVRTFGYAADQVAAAVVRSRVGLLLGLTLELRARFEATAAVLDDAIAHHGSMRVISEAVARAEVDYVHASDRIAVRLGGQEIGPAWMVPDGGWTAAGVDAPFRSWEGAVAALVHSAEPR
ncbi:hypothetical protein ACFXKF_32845 [Streptomyces scopuliridis]|uniref:hypothetical protein n=1 Tax=Streptomyces scopuliridis TaxID=452529 RepID=UPI003693FE53